MVDFIDYDNQQTTVILLHTVLEGSLSTEGDLEIIGNVYGSVSCYRYCRISGTVEGDVSVNELLLTGKGELTGNVTAYFDVLTAGKLTGNIQCRSVEVKGTVEGDITAEDAVIIRADAEVHGDIRCRKLTVEPGAIINGNVRLGYR